MNILITAPSLNPSQNVSGVSSVVQTIIQYNKQQHYYHYLLGRPDKKRNKIIWFIQMIKQIVAFPFALKRNKIDLVHQNLPFDPKGLTREYIINWWCRIMRTPVLLHIHGGIFLMNGTNNPILRKMAKSLFEHCKQVVVLSELEKDAINNLYQFPSTIVLVNSVNTALYQSAPKKLPEEKPTLLFLGRIHESKGVEDIMEAFRILKKQMDFRFLLCGAGPLKDQFVSDCEQLLGDDFEFQGVVSGQKKIDMIQKAHFLLLPSRYGEGLPIALLETMAAGVVPVVTDDASMKFVVQHQLNGIRVEKNNPKDLYEKLSFVLTDPINYKYLSENSVKTIESKYDITNYIYQLNNIYISSLDKNKLYVNEL